MSSTAPSSSGVLTSKCLDDFENRELPLRKDDVTREKPLGRNSVRSLACDDAAGLSPPSGDDAMGDMTVSSGEIMDGCSTGGS